MNEHGSGSGHPGGESGVPEFILEPDDGSSISRGWTVVAALLGVIALVAVLAGVANLRADGSSQQAHDTESTDPEAPDTQPSPTPLDLSPAGPRDGLDSRRLPITVEPAHGLVDGQVVTVNGSQFPPNVALGVVMCSALVDQGGGAAQCQLSPYTSVESDAAGNFSVEYAVPRLISVGGELIDCAGTPPEGLVWRNGVGVTTSCVVAVGAIADYDESGIFPVEFDGAAPAPERPAIEVSPSEGLTDGDILTVTLSGVADDWAWWPNVCTTFNPGTRYGADHGEYGTQTWCEPLGGAWYDLNTGPVEASISRWFGFHNAIEPIDCGEAPGRCWIEVYTNPIGAETVPLSFDPSIPAGPPPTIDYTDPPELGITQTTVVHSGS